MTESKHTYIIAEAGVNHNGSIELAKQLILEAKKAGADAVKFQTFKASKLVSHRAPKAAYQKELTSSEESHYEMIRKLELSPKHHEILIAFAKTQKIEFLSSPFDEASAKLLVSYGLKTLKIPSGEIVNLPFLRSIGAMKLNVILSTGMSTIGEVEEAVDTLQSSGVRSLTLLHCVTQYPTPYDQVNLKAMHTLKSAFGLPVGYSDHTPGIEISLAAVALGAKVIEKHFTIDKNFSGPDHKASLEPKQLQELVSGIRNIEVALGDGVKRPAKCEIANINVARKSLIVKKALKKGETIKKQHLDILRPGNGIPPSQLENVIGLKVGKDLAEHDVLYWNDLK